MDEPLLRTIAAEIRAAIPGAEVRVFGSRARGTERPDSDLDLLVERTTAVRFRARRETGFIYMSCRKIVDCMCYAPTYAGEAVGRR
ncbi:MAG: nucleotidyltransferase family protein [Cyanobium sp.]